MGISFHAVDGVRLYPTTDASRLASRGLAAAGTFWRAIRSGTTQYDGPDRMHDLDSGVVTTFTLHTFRAAARI